MASQAPRTLEEASGVRPLQPASPVLAHRELGADPAREPSGPLAPPASPAPSAPAPAEADATSALAFADDDADLQAALLASMADSSDDAPLALVDGSPLFAQFERPPLVSAPRRLEPSPQLRTSADGSRALAVLGEQGAQLVGIRGDGHCMFRAIGAGLVLAVREMAPEQARPLAASLCGLLAPRAAELGEEARGAAPAAEPEPFGSGSITSASGGAEEPPLALLGALHDGSLPSCSDEAVRAALASPQSSDALVAALRCAACEHMRAHAARFRACEAALGSPFDEYLSNMERLRPDDRSPRYGGAVELQALAEHLGVRIDVYDLEVLRVAGGEPQRVPPSYEFSYARDAEPAEPFAMVELPGNEPAVAVEEEAGAEEGGADGSWVVLARPQRGGLLRDVTITLLRTGLHYHLLTGVGGRA